MSSMILHRGPDDEGFYESEWFSAAFRRLKIIDLSEKAHQPMFDFSGDYLIVFNGEIYNYLELRKELISAGFSFKSDSDTETLLNSYLHWGEACLSKFCGMFAFLIADLKKRKIFFARDQLGIKPLHIYDDGDRIVFASEMKSLIPLGGLEPDWSSLNEYLVFRSLPGANTLVKNMRRLLPGHSGTYSKGNLRISQYFSLAETMRTNKNISFSEACAETEAALEESVKFHMRSDVELGVQLSGGVDSSLISAIASKTSPRRLHSFSISFDDPALDESEYQKRVSERYGTIHHDYRMDEALFVSLLDHAVWSYEEPLNDPNSVCTLHLALKSKEYITVMLSGEGADESFLGYARFNPISVAILARRNFLFKHALLRKSLLKFWPMKKGRDIFKVSAYRPSLYSLTYADLNLLDGLLSGDGSCMSYRNEIADLAANILDEAILQDEVCDLPQWFYRADKMGMAASLEFRVPFCTEKLFRLANSFPYEIRVAGGERKAVLKKIAEKYIDKDQIYRKKIGFGTPVESWMRGRGPYRELFDDTINSNSFKERHFLNHRHFQTAYDADKSGIYKEGNSAFLWTYFNVELWYRSFFEDAGRGKQAAVRD